MVEIKRGPMTITRKTNDFKAFTETNDGLYIKFSDDIEIIIPIALDANQKAVIMTASRINAKSIVIDLDNRTNPVQVQM